MLLIFISSEAAETAVQEETNSPLPQVVRAPDLNHNSYYHSSTLQYLKRANRYFPTIERILREHGVPDDFKYLAVAESGLRHVTSSASAKGFWQFMKLAGKEYGLEINDEVMDGRFSSL